MLLTLHAGRTLERAQVAGIVHLVSASVPELNTAVGQRARPERRAAFRARRRCVAAGALDAQQLQYVGQIEANHVRRILDLLEPVVGRDNLRAQVNAEIDFSQSEATHEEFKPNQGGARGGSAQRATQRIEQRRSAAALRRSGRRKQPAAGAGHRADQRQRAGAASGAERQRAAARGATA